MAQAAVRAVGVMGAVGAVRRTRAAWATSVQSVPSGNRRMQIRRRHRRKSHQCIAALGTGKNPLAWLARRAVRADTSRVGTSVVRAE